MQITSFSIYRYKLPLTRPLQLPMRTLHRREGLLIRVASEEGNVGWGEASPLPGFSEERLQQATRQAFKLKRIMTGSKLEDGWQRIDELMEQVGAEHDLVPSVRYGLELSMGSLLAETKESILPELLCDSSRETVSINALVYGEREEILEETEEAVEEGYRAVKLKVGERDVEEDIDLVKEVAEITGENVQLRLDANQAWDEEQATQFIEATEDAGWEYLEEPLFRPKKLKEFAESISAPIALDESLRGVHPDDLADYDFAAAFILKPTVLGGISGVQRFVESADELGIKPVISSSFETGVGTLGLVALTAALSDEDIPAGLDAYRRLKEDVIRPPLKFENGSVNVPSTMGAKRTLNGHMLREV